MSLLSYVVNWDELALSLATDVNVNVEDIGGAIDSNLPDVIGLLEQIRDILYQNGAKYRNYNQKIEGFYLKTNENLKTIDWTNEENCYLTGITCSHSHVEAVDDFFMLSLIKLDEETGEETIELIFDKVYLKDALQHKYFNKYFPVPAGAIVRITHNNPSSLDKHVWYDLEYLEFFGLREDEEWDDIPIYEPPVIPEPVDPEIPIEPEEPVEPEIPVDPEEPELPVNIPIKHVLLGEKVSENDGVGYTLITLDGAVLGIGDRLIDYIITANVGDLIYLQQDVYYDIVTGLSDYEFIEWKDQTGKLNTSTLEVTSNLSGLVCMFKRKDIETPEEPVDPSESPDGLFYFCDNSISANSIDTDYFNWNQLTLDFMIHQEGYNITGDFWKDRNLLLDFFYNLPEIPDPYNDYRKNKITIKDFHKLLFKSLNDSRLGILVINQDWQQFKTWADANLSCLTDLQKGSLFYTIKSKIITNLFPTAEGFIEGKVPDVICKYLSRLPYRVVDWIDYNDVKMEPQGSNSVTGAYAVDLFTSQYPTLLDAFSSYVNMEPQTLSFGIQSLSASNPSDYINAQGNFWGASVPPSIVDWTNYITSEFASGDTEIQRGLVATETAVHELGHCVDYYYTKDLDRFLTESNEWYNIGGWTKNPQWNPSDANSNEWNYLTKTRHANLTGGMPKLDNNKEAPVSDYGCSQPMEDFAEAFNVYIINPNLLKDKYPQRFAYMEKYVKPLL